MSAVARLENHRAEKSGNLAIFYPLLALSLSNSCPGMPISVCFLSSPLRLIIAFGVVTNQVFVRENRRNSKVNSQELAEGREIYEFWLKTGRID